MDADQKSWSWKFKNGPLPKFLVACRSEIQKMLHVEYRMSQDSEIAFSQYANQC